MGAPFFVNLRPLAAPEQARPAAAGIGPCRTAGGDYNMSSVSAASEAPPACTVIPQEVASGSIWSA